MLYRNKRPKYICAVLSLPILFVVAKFILLLLQIKSFTKGSLYLLDQPYDNLEPTDIVVIGKNSRLAWKTKQTEMFDDVLTTMTPKRNFSLLPLRIIPAWRVGWIAEPIIDPTLTFMAVRGTKVLYGFGGNISYTFFP